ncbi:hypothetical protein GCM10009006_35670 [Haloarcula argentinensis]|uniref:Uncharacterized protein n=1 Tax=Haloarcula argentinensis TaxID=43776 RepID=A0A830FX32_HALAR|nr:hypothetical protein GCM10009006_35670 [Haloarcula argentinensis]
MFSLILHSDFYKQLDRAVRKVDFLDGTQQRRAKQFIAETDGAGDS